MKTTLIKDAVIVNEDATFRGSVLIEDEIIARVYKKEADVPEKADRIIQARENYLIPGVIDDHVHFREPGLTHKADMTSESRAALAGGVTSWMEMPNTLPQTTTLDLLEEKFALAATRAWGNYSFYLGATNDNLEEIIKVDPRNVCGVKLFMGASTGNMLVDHIKTLQGIFAESPALIATHCEDDQIIRQNAISFKKKYGEDPPIKVHPWIRNAEACYRSSALAVELAQKYGSRLHVLHLSTSREMGLFNEDLPPHKKKITAEACVHHLWFTDKDYEEKGSFIKWNPAVKTADDRRVLRNGILNGKLDVIATDHAPHTLEEKQNSYFKCPSGAPMIQHSLSAMFELSAQGLYCRERIIELMCHNPAVIFKIKNRGFIREGYYADLALVHPNRPWTVSKDNILYKCGWSPLENTTLSHRVTHTFVNGKLVYELTDEGEMKFNEPRAGRRLEFDH